jgi:hypothetical protein
MIKNMGLFWKRDNVFWGKPNNPGRLLGRHSSAKREDAVDFWKQVGIYALYANYRLVYVGQTGTGKINRLGNRLRQHTQHDLAGRWDTFSWFGICYVKNGSELSEVPNIRNAKINEILDLTEAILISVGEPSLNRQGGRFGGDVERYLQEPDERAMEKGDNKIEYDT